jgi:6-phosphogluconolactonase
MIDLARAAAEYFVSQSAKAVAERGSFTVALSGGSTPKALYELLASPSESFRDKIPWPDIHFFWSDERHVPPDNPDSNYHMANDAMLSSVPVSQNNIHRIHGENPHAAQAAQQYEEEIQAVTGEDLPRLDLVLLGLGADGHTASIFPDSELLHETERLVAAPWVEKLNTHRITMTLPLLNNATSVVFLVSGSEKAEIVKEVLEGPKRYPAQAVSPVKGELLWLLDKEAASKLNAQAQRNR